MYKLPRSAGLPHQGSPLGPHPGPWPAGTASYFLFPWHCTPGKPRSPRRRRSRTALPSTRSCPTAPRPYHARDTPRTPRSSFPGTPVVQKKKIGERRRVGGKTRRELGQDKDMDKVGAYHASLGRESPAKVLNNEAFQHNLKVRQCFLRFPQRPARGVPSAPARSGEGPSRVTTPRRDNHSPHTPYRRPRRHPHVPHPAPRARASAHLAHLTASPAGSFLTMRTFPKLLF